jgi:hypothetical protein
VRSCVFVCRRDMFGLFNDNRSALYDKNHRQRADTRALESVLMLQLMLSAPYTRVYTSARHQQSAGHLPRITATLPACNITRASSAVACAVAGLRCQTLIYQPTCCELVRALQHTRVEPA